ncbi:xanthine dehydrogenase [Bacillus salipaludis]|uniref:Xanthine dehydrogenase n=1 Tax=Bacillus salipaludis TaxID=2547811 RepID=A0A4R5VK70_9BACI|nr:XdhC/CoxI family protein [Bacillus salipaludis]MDQ6598998.1 XdhC/CoxI family protein [Bacillus salipaludis]TDK58307.1 xanthine dehydrogenase [Bacillus salipaludis]
MLLMEKVALLTRQNETFALAMIIESKGSTPRHVGKMIVYRDGTIEGTVGGGLAEHYVIEECVKAIENGQSNIVEYKLNKYAKDGIDMDCGGTVRVFIEVYTSRPELVLVGAGHIGYAVAKLADFLEYPYCIVDDRVDYCTRERFPHAANLFVNEDIEKALLAANLNEKSYVAIFTKDCDDIALKTALQFPCAYIGMVASKRRAIHVFEKLKSEGVTPEQLEQVHSPIGLKIGSETSEEIAIGIIGEIIKVNREKRTLKVKQLNR